MSLVVVIYFCSKTRCIHSFSFIKKHLILLRWNIFVTLLKTNLLSYSFKRVLLTLISGPAI
jgi:hypothetical protein